MQARIEAFYDRRNQKRLEKKSRKKTFKSELLDWLNSLLFAAVVVFFVSLYLIQLFVVPSASMENTFNVGDRIGVSKRVFGTELYAFGPKSDKRYANFADVVVFYNPEYKPKGALRENLSNILFLLTLSLYNPSKEGKLYVKRAVGLSGDYLKFIDGNLYIKNYSKRDFRKENSISYNTVRLYDEAIEEYSRLYGILSAYYNNKVQKYLPAFVYENPYFSDVKDDIDYYTSLSSESEYNLHISPYSTLNLSDYHQYKNGIYVPERNILPLGDNRDNSSDGRFFGTVSMKSVIGKGIFKFWPLREFKKL